MSVYLTKRAEAYVRFGRFCNNHNLSPTAVAEVITLNNQLSKNKGYRHSQATKEEVIKRLTSMGFTDIKFYEEPSPTFIDKNGDKCYLPEFI